MNADIGIIVENERFLPEIRYIFGYLLALNNLTCCVDTFSTFKAIESKSLIVYARTLPKPMPGNFLQIVPHARFWDNYLKPASLPERIGAEYRALPVIFSSNPPQLSLSRGRLITDLDIVSSALFLLTRCEEYIIADRDQYGRFAHKYSLLPKELVRRPLVNDYALLLAEWLDAVLGIQSKRPQNKNGGFSVVLTHDVDHLQLFQGFSSDLRVTASMLMSRHSISSAARFLSARFRRSLHHVKDPYDTVDYLMDLSERYSAPSTFFFMTDNIDRRDGSYSPDSPLIKKSVDLIIRRGHDIGLHGSFRSSAKALDLRKQKAILENIAEKKVESIRQHYLRFEVPATWQAQANAGFSTDLTLGYAENIGFRAGSAMPFIPFDLRKRQLIDLVELSTAVMDVTLFEPHYLGLSVTQAMRYCEQLIDRVIAVNGILVLLWHNSSLTDILLPGWRQFYEDLLSLVRSKNGVFNSVSSAAALWRDRLMSARESATNRGK